MTDSNVDESFDSVYEEESLIEGSVVESQPTRPATNAHSSVSPSETSLSREASGGCQSATSRHEGAGLPSSRAQGTLKAVGASLVNEVTKNQSSSSTLADNSLAGQTENEGEGLPPSRAEGTLGAVAASLVTTVLKELSCSSTLAGKSPGTGQSESDTEEGPEQLEQLAGRSSGAGEETALQDAADSDYGQDDTESFSAAGLNDEQRPGAVDAIPSQASIGGWQVPEAPDENASYELEEQACDVERARSGVGATSSAPQGQSARRLREAQQKATQRWLETRAPRKEVVLMPRVPGPPATGMATLMHKLHTTAAHNFPISCVAFSPDGALLATASRDVRLYDAATAKLRLVLDGHGGLVRCLAFSPDGRALCSGSDDAAVVVWALDACLAQARPGLAVTLSPPGLPSSTHPGPAPSSPSPTASRPTTPRSVAGGSLAPPHPHAPSAGSGSGSGSGSRSGSAVGSAAAVVLRVLRRHHKPVLCCAATPDSKYLVTGSADRTVRVWDLGSGYCTATLRGHRGDVAAVAVTPNGRTILSGGVDRAVLAWNAATGECTRTLKGHKGPVSSIAVAPDGQWLITGGHDKALRVWDLANGAELAVLPAHGGAFGVLAAAASPDGSTLASGGYDCCARLWDAHSGLPLATLEGHRTMVSCVAFSPDCRTLATAGRDDDVRMWAWRPAHLEAGDFNATPATHRRQQQQQQHDGTRRSTHSARGAGAIPVPEEQLGNRHWACLFGEQGAGARPGQLAAGGGAGPRRPASPLRGLLPGKY